MSVTCSICGAKAGKHGLIPFSLLSDGSLAFDRSDAACKDCLREWLAEDKQLKPYERAFTSEQAFTLKGLLGGAR